MAFAVDARLAEGKVRRVEPAINREISQKAHVIDASVHMKYKNLSSLKYSHNCSGYDEKSDCDKGLQTSAGCS
jgi:hypothetical protein